MTDSRPGGRSRAWITCLSAPDASGGRLETDVAARPSIRLDPGYGYLDDLEATVAYVVTFNAVNFGSGWWPELVKVPGRSGSITIMSRLRDHFETAGPLWPEELVNLTVADCERLFGQPLRSP